MRFGFAVALAVALSVPAGGARVLIKSSVGVYEAFLREFGIKRSRVDRVSFLRRAEIFEQRREMVAKHNAQPGISWKAAVNKFSDYTDSEFRALLGHHSARRMGLASPEQVTSLLQAPAQEKLANIMDWRTRLNTSAFVKDQGSCGSCWAVAAVGSLEAHAELSGYSQPVSYEQVVDCAPNPKSCGGVGGCTGSTAELAFEYVARHGLSLMSEYDGYWKDGEEDRTGKCKPAPSSLLSITGFVRLETNKLQPLLRAVATEGPIVVSADASDWNHYHSGVFDSCSKDATVNHAILMIGYGTDRKLTKPFWLIRNSWGVDWGEAGYLRLLRHTEDGYCGVDTNPLDGVGCKGGPSTLPVCGMCGILSDSSYPIGVRMTARSTDQGELQSTKAAKS